MTIAHNDAMVTRRGLLDMQVCVPADWSDENARDFASYHNPCGTRHGWEMRRNGDSALGGDNERTPCEERDGFVHITFDA